MKRTLTTTCFILAAFLAAPAWAAHGVLEKAEKYEHKYHEKLEDAREEAAKGDWKDYRRDLKKAEQYKQRAEYYRGLSTHGNTHYYAPTRYRSYSGRYSYGYPYNYRAPSHRSYRYYGYPRQRRGSYYGYPYGGNTHGFRGRGYRSSGSRHGSHRSGYRSYGGSYRSYGSRRGHGRHR